AELGHVPQEVADKAMGTVEIREASVALCRELVSDNPTSIEARKGTVIDGLGESVRTFKLQPAGEPSVQCDLKRVVGGLCVRLIEVKKRGLHSLHRCA